MKRMIREVTMIYIIVSILLLMMSIQDIKERSVSTVYIVILAVVCAMGGLFFIECSWMDQLGGCSVGLCLLGISVLTQEQIGAGDGLVVAALGLMTGAMKALTILSVASLLMAGVSIILIIIKKGTRKMKLPFLPAISVGYVICMWI